MSLKHSSIDLELSTISDNQAASSCAADRTNEMNSNYQVGQAAPSLLSVTGGSREPRWRLLLKMTFGSWFYILLVAVPAAWIAHFVAPERSILIFILSFVAILPLAKLLAFATDELSSHVGQALAGLINAALGNAVELIVAILALFKCELRIVQSSLLGSMLSNLALVLGFCFFAGGINYSEQSFPQCATQMNTTMVVFSVASILILIVFDLVAKINGIDIKTEQGHILTISHVMAVVFLYMYFSYIHFQLFSHKSLFDSADVLPGVMYPSRTKSSGRAIRSRLKEIFGVKPEPDVVISVESVEPVIPLGGAGNKDDELHYKLWESIFLLLAITAFTAVTAEWLVDSINGLTSTGKISKEFVGFILLPIVGNAAEHATAVTVSVHDKMTLSTSVAIGSSIQIAFFVIPVTVIIGWISGHPLSMLFDPLESIMLFFAILTVNYVIQDGRSNWLEGKVLVFMYIFIAVVIWFYSGSELTGLLSC